MHLHNGVCLFRQAFSFTILRSGTQFTTFSQAHNSYWRGGQEIVYVFQNDKTILNGFWYVLYNQHVAISRMANIDTLSYVEWAWVQVV